MRGSGRLWSSSEGSDRTDGGGGGCGEGGVGGGGDFEDAIAGIRAGRG